MHVTTMSLQRTVNYTASIYTNDCTLFMLTSILHWSLSLLILFCLHSVKSIDTENPSGCLREDTLLTRAQRSSESYMKRKRSHGGIIDTNNVQMLEERRDIFYFLSFIVHNTKPVGHQVSSCFWYGSVW